jgi:hypothetical protein
VGGRRERRKMNIKWWAQNLEEKDHWIVAKANKKIILK